MQLVFSPFGNCWPPPPPRLVFADGKAYIAARPTPRIVAENCSPKPAGCSSSPKQLGTPVTRSEDHPLLSLGAAAAVGKAASLSQVS